MAADSRSIKLVVPNGAAAMDKPDPAPIVVATGHATLVMHLGQPPVLVVGREPIEVGLPNVAYSEDAATFDDSLRDLGAMHGHRLGDITYEHMSGQGFAWSIRSECKRCSRVLVLLAEEPPAARYLLMGEGLTSCRTPLIAPAP